MKYLRVYDQCQIEMRPFMIFLKVHFYQQLNKIEDNDFIFFFFY